MLKQMKVLARGSPMHTTWCVSQKESPLELRCWSFPQHLHLAHLGCVELHRLLEALACSITEPGGSLPTWRTAPGGLEDVSQHAICSGACQLLCFVKGEPLEINENVA